MISNKVFLHQPQQFEELFRVGEMLGSGGFGTVYAGTRIKDNLPVAIKHIAMRKIRYWEEIDGCNVPMEAFIMNQLRNVPGVIKLRGWFVSPKTFSIIMDRQEPSQDLFDYITERGSLDERTAQFFFRQIVEIVLACYENHVIHRDLKDDNILVNLETLQLTLIDFGAARLVDDADTVLEFGGTDIYCPPEFIASKIYNSYPATIWSLGILLYVMVSGNFPFLDNQEILEAKIQFITEISPECQNLIMKLLSFHPQDRPNLEDIIYHDWFLSPSS